MKHKDWNLMIFSKEEIMSVRRVYVEKKPAYAVKAHELKEEIASYLGIETVTDVRVLIRYDIENLSEETYKTALETIFSEPPTRSTRRHFREMKMMWCLQWSTCRASSIRGPILRSSV